MKRKLLFAIVALMCSVGTWAQQTFTETFDLTGRAGSDWSSISNATVPSASGKTFDVVVNGTNNHLMVWGGGTGTSGVDIGGRNWGNTAMGFKNVKNGSTVAFTVTDASMLSALTLCANSDKVSYTDEGSTRTFTVNSADVTMLDFNFPQNGTQVVISSIAYTYQVDVPSGFTKVTNLSELNETNFNANYYMIASEADPSLVLRLNVDNAEGNTDLDYQTQNVLSNLEQLWTLEVNGEDGFSLRNVKKDHLLLQTESYGAYPIRHNDQPYVCDWTKLKAAADANGGFTIENGKYSGNYLGLWEPKNDYKNDEDLAANKQGNDVGHFYIFSIPRATFNAAYASNHTDLTDLLLNPAVVNGVGWAGGNTNSGQQYTGAPDNTYLDRNNAEMNTNQSITLPAGDYIIKAATRASTTQANGHLYVYTTSGDIDTNNINKKGSTGNVLGNGWDWTMMSFTLTEQTTVGIGFYMGKSSWAGVDDWHLYKVDGTTPADIVSAFNAKLSDEPQNAAEKSAAQTAISTLQSTWSVNNFKDARTKVATTENSVKAYVTLKAEIDELAEIMAATNVYTAAAKTAAEAFATGYDAGTLADNLAGNIMGTRTWHQSNLAVSSLLLSAWNATSTVGATNTWGDYYINTWSVEGDTDGTNMTEPFYEYYTADANTLGDKVLQATLTTAEGIEASATYQVSALVRLKVSSSSSSTPTGITFQVADGTAVNACSDLSTTSSSGYLYRTVTAYGASDAEGNLTIKFNVSGTNCSWLAFKNVKYTKVETDLSALKTAIDAGDAVTFGFADGEYAPYNNTAMLTALANAKTIYNNAAGKTQTEIDDAKDALNTAISSMVANSGEVSAISLVACYNADNKDTENRLYAAGWDKAGRDDAYNTRLMKSSNAGLAAVDNELALFTKGNTSYGKEAGYTLPLKANTLYKLSFKYCGWGNTPNTTVSFTDPLSNVITLAPDFHPATNDGDSNSEHWYDYTGYFMSTAAGDYVLNLNKVESGQQQIAMGNIDLRTASELPLAENTAYAAGTYPAVTLDRTFSADKWNTLCVPFAFDKSNFAAVKVLSSVAEVAGDVNMKFADADDTVDAGTPCLVKAENNGDGLTVTNVTLNPAAEAGSAEATVGTTTVTYQGTYSSVALNSANSDAWVVSNNNLYNVDSDVTVGAYRAYFTVASSGDVKALSFDFGTATGINTVQGSGFKVQDSKIFNLAGQKMSKLQKGVNIVNGKKVLVK